MTPRSQLMNDQSENVALVTGANRGIGLEVCRHTLRAACDYLFSIGGYDNAQDSRICRGVGDDAAGAVLHRAPRGRPRDVLIDILYCGVCHSDIHQARDEWGGSIFPMVPGHEIVGTVVKVGEAVDEMEGRRHGRGRLFRRFLPRMRSLQSRRGAVLRARHDPDLQRL